MTQLYKKTDQNKTVRLEVSVYSHGIHKFMTRLTVFDVSKVLQMDGVQLVQLLRQLGIFNAAYEPKSRYVANGYFECVIEPNPAAPGYGMLSVFVTPRGLVFVQYLVCGYLCDINMNMQSV